MISHAVRIFFEKKILQGFPTIFAHFGSFWLIIAILNALNTLKNGKNGSLKCFFLFETFLVAQHDLPCRAHLFREMRF